MKMSKNKIATLIALLLMLTIAMPLIAIPTANADSTRVTYAYLGIVPNPTGVGQQVTLHVGITHPTAWPQPGWVGLSVTVTDPDGHTSQITGINTDPTGGTGVTFTPEKTGIYYFQTHFPEQVLVYGARGTPDNTTMLASDSEKTALVVQEEPIQYYPGQPLPTEYWTRPIDSQLREWSTVAGNWLMPTSGLGGVVNKVALSNDAPESAHILWTKQLAIGGLVGGEEAYDGHGYYTGDAYEGLFGGAIILNGVLYYNRFEANSPTQDVVAVDLHTGEELWVKNWNNTRLSFGQILKWDTLNGHGAYAFLWTTSGSTWNAYDPVYGTWVYGMTNVPGGTNYYGPNGEILKYAISNGRLLRWNSTWAMKYDDHRTVYSPYSFISGHARLIGTTHDASGGYDLNVTVPAGLTGSIITVLDDRIIGGSIGATQSRVWGLSLERGQEGTLLFDATWDNPDAWITGNQTLSWEAFDSEDLVGVLWAMEVRQHYGVSFETGELIWGPTHSQDYRDQFYQTGSSIAYGNLYASGIGGTLYCYNDSTGELQWTYNATDTYVEFKISPDWWLYITFISDGKIYVGHYEHSSGDPKPRGAPFLCLNATTGDKIWEIDGAFRQTMWGDPGIIGDSIIATMDTYDQRIYAIGKGPSATTVTAPGTSVTAGNSLVITGTVTDVSPGTNDAALTMRFPNGVPAVSDESMSDWMLYVHKQFPRPTNATGVEVTLDAIDPNGNFVHLGNATSDASGFFGFNWVTPDIPGFYTIIATFAGSKSYYASYAETAAVVTEAPAATPEPTPQPASMADLYLLPSVVGIIIAIAVVGVVIVLMLRKR
jgi:outer membrane protein assembly factor BamB